MDLLPTIHVFGAMAAHEGCDALGRHSLELVVAVGVGSSLQGESVERGGDHEPGQLLSGDAGILDAQQPAGSQHAAAMHAGDWLLKLQLNAAVLGLIH